MALLNSYEGFIFDFGGVLVSQQTEEDQARLASLAGISGDDLVEQYWVDRLEYDKGDLSGPEYWQRLVSRVGGRPLTEEQLEQLYEADANSWMHFDEVMWEWLDQLRVGGKRIAMLSNMPRELGEALKVTTDRLSQFDQVTLSYEVRSVKPEPAIYEHCLEGLGTSADATLFFDDKMPNVQGAELLGIRAIQFIDRDDVLLRVRG